MGELIGKLCKIEERTIRKYSSIVRIMLHYTVPVFPNNDRVSPTILKRNNNNFVRALRENICVTHDSYREFQRPLLNRIHPRTGVLSFGITTVKTT